MVISTSGHITQSGRLDYLTLRSAHGSKSGTNVILAEGSAQQVRFSTYDLHLSEHVSSAEFAIYQCVFNDPLAIEIN